MLGNELGASENEGWTPQMAVILMNWALMTKLWMGVQGPAGTR